MRKRKDGGMSLLTIEKLLNNTKDPKSYTKLRMTSTPIFKQGFNTYLKWCKERAFLNWYSIPMRDRGGRSVIYSLSEKGRTFLEMIA